LFRHDHGHRLRVGQWDTSRVLLRMVLTTTSDVQVIQRVFDEY
jgi:hypothetical protein